MTSRTDRTSEVGSGLISAVVVLTAMLLIAAAGTMIDGGRILTTRRHVATIAFEAARAGTQQVSTDALHQNAVALDPTTADTATRTAFTALAAGTNATLTAVRVTATDVSVTVTEAVRPWFPLLSPSTVTVTGHARILTTAP